MPHSIPPHSKEAVGCQALLAGICPVVAALLMGISLQCCFLSCLPDSSGCDLNSLGSWGMDSGSAAKSCVQAAGSNKTLGNMSRGVMTVFHSWISWLSKRYVLGSGHLGVTSLVHVSSLSFLCWWGGYDPSPSWKTAMQLCRAGVQ